MRNRPLLSIVLSIGVAALLWAGCGGSGNKGGGQGSSSNNSPGALSAEAQAAATGDIPDNQAFLTFTDSAAGFSLSYPEGWAQQGSGSDVTFKSMNNLIHVVVGQGSSPTPASVGAALTKLKSSTPSLKAGAPQQTTIKGAPVIKASYQTQSPPNPVTGKRVTLTVDRYVFAHGGKVATLDLGTAVGVDNVDAYRMISESFKWR